MKNPNWRTRGDLDGSEGPDFETRCCQATSGPRESGHLLDLRYSENTLHSGASDRRNLSSSDDTTGHAINARPHVRLHTVSADTESWNEEDNSPAYDSGQYQLVKEKALPSYPDVCLLEVRPIWPSQNDRQEFTLVDIQRLNNSPSTWEPTSHRANSDEQSEQFAAAMGAADKTPRRVKPTMSPPVLAHPNFVTKGKSPFDHKYKHAILKDSAVANVSRLKNDEGLDQTTSMMKTRDESQQGGLQSNDRGGAAFEKLLAKLHRGPRGAYPQRSSATTEPKPEPALHKPQATGPAVFSLAESSAGGRRQINNTHSSDSGYGSSIPGGNSGVVTNSNKTSSNAFNPKAREFLSFAEKHQKSEEDQEPPPRYRRIPVEELFARKQDDSRPTAGFGVHRMSPGDGTPSTYSANPEDISGSQEPSLPVPLVDMGALFNLWSPLTTPNYSAFPYQNASANWGPNQTPNHAVPPPTVLPGGSWPLGMFNHAATGANFIPLPGTSVTPPLDMLANTGANPASTAPCSSHAHMSRPAPVPKPRKPDPGNQQAYEAWIEWRKANEPGYAMECKLRQQRRSQRNTASKSKSETTPKEEVPAAA